MSRIIWTVFCGIIGGLIPAFSLAQTLPFHQNIFKEGEELTYVIRYGFIKGGEATLKIVRMNEEYRGRSSIHFVANGKTSGTFDIFYKVRNRYESYIDPNTFLPFAYMEDIHENKYTRSGTTEFDYHKKQATNKSGQFPISEWTRDIVSSYYFARSIDLSKIKVGDNLSFSYFLENGVNPLNILYLGKEIVNSPTGKYECLKFSPSLESGRIFKKDSKMFIWISDDENHIPIKAKADILVGSIILELKDFKNLIKPLNVVNRE